MVDLEKKDTFTRISFFLTGKLGEVSIWILQFGKMELDHPTKYICKYIIIKIIESRISI
jgi:hypothetical protein